MAKESLNLNNPTISVSLSRMEGKSIIKEACNWKWQGNWNDCKTGRQFYNIRNRVSPSKMILNLSREDQVILTRLRMGHTKLNSTLHIIGNHSTGLCEICQVKETVDHVLLLCPRYEQERNELQRELQNLGCTEFSICNILSTKQGSGKIIKTILKFIKNRI